MEEKLTEAEYGRRMAELRDQAEPARLALNEARARYESVCEEMAALSRAWREQQQGGARHGC